MSHSLNIPTSEFIFQRCLLWCSLYKMVVMEMRSIKINVTSLLQPKTQLLSSQENVLLKNCSVIYKKRIVGRVPTMRRQRYSNQGALEVNNVAPKSKTFLHLCYRKQLCTWVPHIVPPPSHFYCLSYPYCITNHPKI